MFNVLLISLSVEKARVIIQRQEPGSSHWRPQSLLQSSRRHGRDSHGIDSQADRPTAARDPLTALTAAGSSRDRPGSLFTQLQTSAKYLLAGVDYNAAAATGGFEH